jgi:hypothetical protein
MAIDITTFKKISLCLFLLLLSNQLFAQDQLLLKKLSSKHGLKVSKIEDADSLYFPKKWFYVHCTDGTVRIYDVQRDVIQEDTILSLHVLDYFNFFNISIAKTVDGKKQWLIYDKRFSRLGWKPVRISFEDFYSVFYADPLIEYPDFIGVKNNQFTFFKVDDEHAKINFKTNLKIKDDDFSKGNLKEILPFHAGFIASFLKNNTISYKKIRRMPTTYTLIDEVDPISKDTTKRVLDADSLGYFTIDKNFDADEIVQLPKPGYANAIIKKHQILHVYNFRQNKVIYSGLAKYDLACGELPVIYTEHGFLFENEQYIVLPTYNIKSINYKKVDNDIIGMVVMNSERSHDKKKYEQKWEINFTQNKIKDLSNGIYTLPQLTSLDSLNSYYDNLRFFTSSIKRKAGDSTQKKTLKESVPYKPWINIKLADEYFLKNECDSALKYYLLSSDRSINNFLADGYFKQQYQNVFDSRLLLDLDQNYLQKELTATSPEHKKLLCSFFYVTGYFHSANSYRTDEVQIKALNELIKQNEGVSELYFYRGILYANLKMHSEAMADFDNMIKLNPSINNYLRRSYYAINSIAFSKSNFKINHEKAQLALSDLNYAIQLMVNAYEEKNYRLYDLYALRANLKYRFMKALNMPFKELKKEICTDINTFTSFYKRPDNEGKTWFKLEKLQKDCDCKEMPIDPTNF